MMRILKSEIVSFFLLPKYDRKSPRFFVQIWHETTDAFIGKKHFFTKQCLTYPKYEQRLQKLGTFLENIVLSKRMNSLFMKSSSQIFLERFDQFLMLKNENQNFVIFAKVAHNFGESDDDIMYLVKICLFAIDA